jgi:hypothetical protein
MFERQNWHRKGHGNYCINSYGYAFSHSDASINCQNSLFGFKKGDTLNFEYNPVKGTLKVYKGFRRFQMNI